MAIEIERKFLVRRELWQPGTVPGIPIRQGYLSTGPGCVVRVRLAGADGFLTIKGASRGIARAEFEYPVPRAEAEFMLDQLCIQPLIEKRRYRIPFGGHIWDVDEFEGENAGLVVAEIELPRPDTDFAEPPWVAREVSGDARYSNASLVTHPYRDWKPRE